MNNTDPEFLPGALTSERLEMILARLEALDDIEIGGEHDFIQSLFTKEQEQRDGPGLGWTRLSLNFWARDEDTREHVADLHNRFMMQFRRARAGIKLFELAPTIKKIEASEKARQRWNNDPKSAAMDAVKSEWERMLNGDVSFRSDAQFARDMMKPYGNELSEGGIKNAIVRWRKERK